MAALPNRTAFAPVSLSTSNIGPASANGGPKVIDLTEDKGSTVQKPTNSTAAHGSVPVGQTGAHEQYQRPASVQPAIACAQGATHPSISQSQAYLQYLATAARAQGGVPISQPAAHLPIPAPTNHTVSYQGATPIAQTGTYVPRPTSVQPVPSNHGTVPVGHPTAYSSYPASHGIPYKRVGKIKLSLISPSEFTLFGSQYIYGSLSTDDVFVTDLRPDIEKLASSHGGAVFERPDGDKDEEEEEFLGTARFRVPLSAYDDVVSFLEGRDDVSVEGIPKEHLRAAELHVQRQEKGYPESKELVEKGVPEHLALTLAGYQRGGVDFVISRDGRALIADEMGLGKTIQSIAAMCPYVNEGALLVISPPVARLNWKAEFLKWLGKDNAPGSKHPALLSEKDIQVLKGGKDKIKEGAKVVICSYSILGALKKEGTVVEGTFKRVIVDESHMLKNTKAERTKCAMPILKSSTRCILLSGTPAFKNPLELFPQLHALGGGKWWEDEQKFKEAYCYKSTTSVGGRNNLELHTLVSSTIMIRRKKVDVLKEVLPEKKRDIAHLPVPDGEERKRLDGYMEQLRDSNGSLGKVARVLQRKNSLKQPPTQETDDVAILESAIKSMSLGENGEVNEEEMGPFLPKLFELSGRVKVPVVVSQLKRWLKENSGKIVVFAHHHSVLNSIEEASLGFAKTIRIDGKTTSKKRQDNVLSFQEDPLVRVAVLSTTAAGVAITLTASSTVWFAEMHWTPGLLIQAEDRCHRIGQKNDVDVLYYVARGTLDEVLWKLAVQKFVAVGEMVDGSSKTLDVNQKGDLELDSDGNEGGTSAKHFFVEDKECSRVVDLCSPPPKSAELDSSAEESSSVNSFDSSYVTDGGLTDSDSDDDEDYSLADRIRFRLQG